MASTNAGPVAHDTTVTVPENTPTTFVLSASDPAGHALRWTILEQPEFGTLSGEAPTLVYTPNPGVAGDDDIVFQVDDGVGGTAKGTVTLSIVPPPEVPRITTSPGATAYWMHDPAVVIDGGITVTFHHSPTLDGATVAITAGRHGLNDVLVFAPTAGISGAYDENAAVLTLTGTASIADYQAAMRTVGYFNHATPPTTDPRTITFAAAGGSATRTVTVAAQENPNPPVTPAATG